MKAIESLENFANYVLAHWKEAPSHTQAGALYRDARTEIQKVEAELAVLRSKVEAAREFIASLTGADTEK